MAVDSVSINDSRILVSQRNSVVTSAKFMQFKRHPMLGQHHCIGVDVVQVRGQVIIDRSPDKSGWSLICHLLADVLGLNPHPVINGWLDHRVAQGGKFSLGCRLVTVGGRQLATGREANNP